MMIKKVYRDDKDMLDSFNELTRNTFGFDFTGWHAAGHFGEMYVPHVILKDGKVVSNVSVNKMQFDVDGVIKNYIQLGTVMTDGGCRGQGLNREIMEGILQEYTGNVDGIYLFGNDSVLDYYPKFGFVPCEEYEYYLPYEGENDVVPYELEKVDMRDTEQVSKLDAVVKDYFQDKEVSNENDALYMSENLDLYHFWLDAEYPDSIFYIPEAQAYAVLAIEDDKLYLYQIFGKQKVDIKRLAKAMEGNFSEIVLGYTPIHKDDFGVRVHKEEDCTLFILGDDLKCISEGKMMFPLLSHA
ncbi:MAG: GNAT family N-acetyltransferase [Lachnospiraceae bacterium]|nr:GNAT family N-acetyltransferase [Lachnospiraceae bacterium]